MKVICVDAGHSKYCPYTGEPRRIKEGFIYTVIDECLTIHFQEAYELAEHIGFVYIKTLFIPISNIDEAELVNQKVEIYDTGVMGRNQSL